MKYTKDDKNCINCEREDYSFARGYCTKCYPLILRIDRIKKDHLPGVLITIKNGFGEDYFKRAKKDYIWQIENRLKILKESNIFINITAHDLEYRINGTLILLDGRSLGKINDPIAFYLKDDKTRSFVYQLFSKIQLLKPFNINYSRLYDAASGR